MTIDRKILEEGADWIAEMVSEDLGGFVPSELCDLVIEHELRIREETGDALMDHVTMATKILESFRDDPDIPDNEHAINDYLIREILHWEDEFRAMAGSPRTVRPS